MLEEENVVKNDSKEGTVHPDVAVQVRGLSKTYPGATQISCCKCKKTSAYHAVRVSNSFPALEYHAGFGLQCIWGRIFHFISDAHCFSILISNKYSNFLHTHQRERERERRV